MAIGSRTAPPTSRGTSRTPSSYGVVAAAYQLGLAALVVPTRSGRTARLVSAHRPQVPILALSPRPETARRCNLLWGVPAATTRSRTTLEELLEDCAERAKRLRLRQFRRPDRRHRRARGPAPRDQPVRGAPGSVGPPDPAATHRKLSGSSHAGFRLASEHDAMPSSPSAAAAAPGAADPHEDRRPSPASPPSRCGARSALEMAHGNDPVLGPKARAAAEPPRPQLPRARRAPELPSTRSDYGYGYYGDYGRAAPAAGQHRSSSSSSLRPPFRAARHEAASAHGRARASFDLLGSRIRLLVGGAASGDGSGRQARGTRSRSVPARASIAG